MRAHPALSRSFLSAALVLAAEGRAARAQDVARFRESVAAVLRETRTPGAAVAVVAGDRVVLSEGFGVANVETQEPITPETLFQLGSLTKLFTATAVLVAAERGAPALDTPVGTYVRGLASCLSSVTLGQLLSHTGGLLDEPDEYGPHDEKALAEYARSWTDDYCLLPAGRAFSYSNSGFALAGLVLQEALGRPYADAMNDLLFSPLGMSRTTFRPTTVLTYPHAVGHRVRDGRAEVVRPMADDARLWPAGEMYSNLVDLERYAIAFLNEGRLDGRPLLSPAVLESLGTPRAEVPGLGQRYGYGLELDTYRGERRAGHGGTMPGFGALLTSLQEKRVAVIVLANRDNAVLDAIGEKAFDEWAFAGKPATKQAPAPTQALPLSAEELDRSTGTFTNPKRWTLEIARKEEGLVLRQFGAELPMTKIGEGAFTARAEGRAEPFRIVLSYGGDGRARYVQFALWTFVRLPKLPR